MTIEGLEQLEALARSLEAVPQRAAARAAPELLQVVKRQHAAGLAPDGSAWPKTRDGRVPLVALTSQATARAEGTAVVLELPDELLPHQAGTSPLPRRQVVPDEGEELPPAWARPLEDALEAELAEASK